MDFPIILYKLDTKGKTRMWSIHVIEYDDYSEIVVYSGLIDGKQIKNVFRISEGKNVGKSNATTHFTQALSEAESRVDLQTRSGYVYDVKDAKQDVLGSGIDAPMLAHKYHPSGEQKGSKTLQQMKLVGKKIVVQPKFDGNRCLIVVHSPDEIVLYTRKGDVFPVQLEHIIESIGNSHPVQNFIEPFVLDGELYSSELTFNQQNGLLKRSKAKPDYTLLSKIHYHLYDCMTDKPYLERYEFIRTFASECIHVVSGSMIDATDENIHIKLTQYLEQGYEGLMVRRLDMPYENKRSWSLVKVKLFEDAEFELIDVEEDARGGFIGAFVMKLPTPVKDRDGNILETFKAGVSGLTQEEGSEILKNKQDYIGKIATVEYFQKSEYGVPRFPKLKAFRELD